MVALWLGVQCVRVLELHERALDHLLYANVLEQARQCRGSRASRAQHLRQAALLLIEFQLGKVHQWFLSMLAECRARACTRARGSRVGVGVRVRGSKRRAEHVRDQGGASSCHEAQPQREVVIFTAAALERLLCAALCERSYARTHRMLTCARYLAARRRRRSPTWHSHQAHVFRHHSPCYGAAASCAESARTTMSRRSSVVAGGQEVAKRGGEEASGRSRRATLRAKARETPIDKPSHISRLPHDRGMTERRTLGNDRHILLVVARLPRCASGEGSGGAERGAVVVSWWLIERAGTPGAMCDLRRITGLRCGAWR